MSYALDDPSGIGIATELASLILIVASFLVMTRLAMKSGRRRTFQLEMFLFTVVLVAAEVPRTLYSLGVIDIDALSTVGLGIHSASMLILSGFVALRVRGFFNRTQVLGNDFKGVVQGAVETTIEGALGLGAVKSLGFYVSAGTAVSDPAGYSRSLEKIFGSGSKVLIATIVKSVCEATKIEPRPDMALAEAIESGREKFISSGSPLPA